MAKLSDIQFSQQGEAVRLTEIPEVIPVAQDLHTPSVKNMQNVILVLTNNKKRGRVYVDGEDWVVNPKTKQMEKIRLVAGEKSIWESEQKVAEKDYPRKRRSLIFEDRKCLLPAWDVQAIEFARVCRHNVENTGRTRGSKHEFYEWNPKRQEEAALKKEMEEIEVTGLAMNVPFDKLKKHAAYLGGISFVDEMGEQRTESGLRVLYVRRAKENPERFKLSLDSKEVEINWAIKRALTEAKLEIMASGSIRWAGGSVICKLPQGRAASEYMLEYAMAPTDEARQFLETLEKING